MTYFFNKHLLKIPFSGGGMCTFWRNSQILDRKKIVLNKLLYIVSFWNRQRMQF